MRIKKRWIVVIGLVVLAIVLFRSRGGAPSIADGSYLLVPVRGSYAEGKPPGLLAKLIEDRNRLLDLLEDLDKAAHDDRIKGVVVKVGALDTGWGQTEEIRQALTRIKATGKKVIGFLDGAGFGGNKEYYLASVADEIYMPPAASSLLNGLSAQYVFLGGMWEKIDVALEVKQIREYKTFGDMLSRRTMSNAHREMADSILDDINAEFLGKLAEARGLSVAELQTIVDASPSTPEAFVDSGLADGVKFLDQVRSDLGGKAPAAFVDDDDYRRVSRGSLGLGGGAQIAVIHASGILLSGKSRHGSGLGDTVGSDTIIKALRDAAGNRKVKAIVLRIDSPGGSPHAADEIWHAVARARKDKPVIASLGDVAASGGYYIAAAADRIITDASTLTGSIGVVMYKPNIAGLLGRAGIGTESLSRGRYARLLDITKGFDRAELNLISEQMESIYALFLARVADGRHSTVKATDTIGKGRVWTGNQAVANGLADELGGIHDAIRSAAEKAGLKNPDKAEIVYYPKAGSLTDQLLNFRSMGAQAWIPRSWSRLAATVSSYWALDPGVYTVAASLPTIR